MKYIGFATKYYTLWEISDFYKVYSNKYDYQIKRDYTYLQNLSFNLESAKEKLISKKIPFEIDLTIRGTSSFLWEGEKGTDLENWQFAGGEEYGNDIRNSNNIQELLSCWNYSKLERMEFAKKRLIELGILKYYNDNYYTQDIIDDIKNKKKFENHFYNDKEKVELKVKEINRYGFEGFYGWTSIVEYLTRDGKGFKYIGTSPLQQQDDLNKFINIKATVKHAYYNEKPETHLQRIKLC